MSVSPRTTCARSLYQDPAKQLVQDLCFRISVWISFRPLVSGSYRATCTRSRIRMLSHHCISPIGALVRDLCIKILWATCARSLFQDLCVRILCLYQDPVGALVQDLCIGIFWPTVSGSYKTTCARSPYQDAVGPLLSGSCRTTSARSLSQDLCVKVLLGHLHQDLVNEQILRDFLENWRSGLPKRKFSARLPRKWRHVSEVLRLPRNHDPRSYEMLHCPRKLILKFKFQKCNPSQQSSPSTSKHSIHGADSLRLSRKTQSFEWHTPANVLATSTKYCACHDFHKLSDSLHLPRKVTFRSSKTIRSPAPVT